MPKTQPTFTTEFKREAVQLAQSRNGRRIPPTFGHQRDLYLAVVLDLFSRMVVGWAVAAIQDATLVEQALQMALARRSPEGDYSTTLIVAVSILQNPIWHCSSSMACCLARSSTASVPATCKPLRAAVRRA